MSKKTKLFYLFVAAAAALSMASCGAKTKAAKKGNNKEIKAPSKYDTTTKEATSQEGPFTVYFDKNSKLYFALSDSAMNRDYLLASRVAATSDSKEAVAGQMSTDPILIRFSKDAKNVYLHEVQVSSIVRPDDPITSSFKRNFLDPIRKAFPIIDTQDGKTLIDVTDFFRTNEPMISPLEVNPPPATANNYIRGQLVDNASQLKQVKSFPYNVEIKGLMTFDQQPSRQPYTLEMHRSILLLPEEPMQMRLQDNRVGLFSSARRYFSTDLDKVERFNIIHRWNLQPSDSAAYLRGELVEPIKPIIFYVDSAFPEKWRPTILQAIEDWQPAFEAAGFKNAIQAREYPKDDPSFDPDDIRYSCIKYATTATANAMGPSHIDPRSGEIICADVIWYHNVISLVHNWRLVQTGAVDPRVRRTVFDDDVMNQSLRYVASHEVGHTIGLMHNMGGSWSFPIDSLRSPSFTQKYGTTPSIMDYARNNFVAQPGDLERGVSMTPPILGVYDIHAIRWAYKLIPEAKTPLEEVPTLNKWIAEKADDPMYTFGAQQYPYTIDPTAQTEDLGNDHFKAGDLSISNLKIIAANIDKWLLEEGKRYNEIAAVYNEILTQYIRHIGHIQAYVGGIKFTENRQGDGKKAYEYVPKAEQQRAIKWLLNEARTLDTWLLTPEQLALSSSGMSSAHKNIRSSIVSTMFDGRAIKRIHDGELLGGADTYKLSEYAKDVVDNVFSASKSGRKLTQADRDIESKAIESMIKMSGLVKEEKKPAGFGISEDENTDWIQTQLAKSEKLPCALAGHKHSANNDETDSFFRLTMFYPNIATEIIAPHWLKALKDIKRIYQSRRASDPFYDYQILRIDRALEGK